MTTAIEERLEELFREYLSTSDDELSMYNKNNYDENVVAWYDAHLKRSPYRWDDNYKPFFAMHALKTYIESYNQKLVSGKLIDIGSGSGCTLANIERLLKGMLSGSNLLLYGIDFSEEGIAVARKRTKTANYFIGDFIAQRFDAQFDYALSLGVFEHFQNPVAAFRKTCDILTPNGLAYVEVPKSDSEEESFGRHIPGRQLFWCLNKSSYCEIIKASGLVILKDLHLIRHDHFAWILGKPGSIWTQKKALSSWLWVGFYLHHSRYSISEALLKFAYRHPKFHVLLKFARSALKKIFQSINRSG